MATTCAKSFISGSVVPHRRPGSRLGLFKCTDRAVVARGSRKRFTVSAWSRNLASLRRSADNAVSNSGAKLGLLYSTGAASLLAHLSSVSTAGALDEGEARSTYEAFVQGASPVAGNVGDTVTAVTSDAGDAIADGTDFTTEDALIVGGVLVFAFAVLFGISRLFKKAYAGDVSAQDALRLLDKDAKSILVDIRQADEISEEGSPKLTRGKKAIRIRYEKEDADGTVAVNPAFVSKVGAKSASKGAAVFVIDSTGSVSVNAAKSLAKAGFKKVYSVKGGTEAWRASELPWLKPTNFTLDLTTLKQAIDDTVKENPNVVPATLGIAAATAGGFLIFSEAETALQLLASAAIAQLLMQKLLFAEDRQKTLEQLKSFLDTKVAPEDLVNEFEEVRGVFSSSQESAESSYATPPPARPRKFENGASSKNGAFSQNGAFSENGASPQNGAARSAANRPAAPGEWPRPGGTGLPAAPAAPKAVEQPVGAKAEQSNQSEQSANTEQSNRPESELPPRFQTVRPFFSSVYEEVKPP